MRHPSIDVRKLLIVVILGRELTALQTNVSWPCPIAAKAANIVPKTAAVQRQLEDLWIMK